MKKARPSIRQFPEVLTASRTVGKKRKPKPKPKRLAKKAKPKARLNPGDFFKQGGIRQAFLAVKADRALKAVGLDDGVVCHIEELPLKVFQNVAFEPSKQKLMMMPDDMPDASIFMTSTDMVIASEEDYYSICGRLTRRDWNGSRFPLMKVILSKAR